MRLYKTEIPAAEPLTAQALAALLADFGYTAENSTHAIRGVSASLQNDFTAFEGVAHRLPEAGRAPLRIEIAGRHASVLRPGHGHEVALIVHYAPNTHDTSLMPEGYRADNVLGALIGALHDRLDGDYTLPQIAEAVAAQFGDGDYGAAEDVLWEEIGPILDLIECRVRDRISQAG